MHTIAQLTSTDPEAVFSVGEMLFNAAIKLHEENCSIDSLNI